MSDIEKIIDDGFAAIIYQNKLGTATVVVVDGEDWAEIQTTIDDLPDEQVIDIRRPITPESFNDALARIRRKINREGEYENWDEKMRSFGLPNASERPSQHKKD